MTNEEFEYRENNDNNDRDVAYMINNNSLAVKDAGENFNPFYLKRVNKIEQVATYLNEEKQAEWEKVTGNHTPTVAELKGEVKKDESKSAAKDAVKPK